MIKRVLAAVTALLVLCVITLFILGGAWRHTEHGTLDFKAAVILKIRGALQKKERPTPAKMRADETARAKSLQDRPMDVAKTANLTLPGPAGEIPVRVYTPSGEGPFPMLLFFHGGGWVIGSLDSVETSCTVLANGARCVVVSVDYRLAPEHPFPAAIDDCYAALVWVRANGKTLNGDPGRIGVCGLSAGANLAAAAALMARDKAGPRISCQALVYPAVNLSALDTASFRYFPDGYALSREDVDFFIECYLPDTAARKNRYASPLLAESLAGLPPALVITAGFDVLRDEGNAYAERLRASGVETAYSNYPTMIHGFVNMGRLFPEAREALEETAVFLSGRLHARR